jgi:hypothetical protein
MSDEGPAHNCRRMRDFTVTDEVRDYASDHGSWPASVTVSTGCAPRPRPSETWPGWEIGDTYLVRTSRWRRARLSAMAKPLDVAAGATTVWS